MITKHEVFGAEQVGRLVKEPAFDHICPLLPLSAGEESVELMGQWVSVPQAQRMATRPDIALESVGSAALGSVMSSGPSLHPGKSLYQVGSRVLFLPYHLDPRGCLICYLAVMAHQPFMWAKSLS